MKKSANYYLTRLGMVAISASALLTGCATMDAQEAKQEQQLVVLQTRLEEAERQNGRMAVKIEELEDEVFLLQDRVDANRLSLQRRGMMRGSVAQGIAQAAPMPNETNYQGRGYQNPQPQQYQRQVTRIPLGQPDTYQDPYADPYAQQQPQQQPQQEPRQRQFERVPTNTVPVQDSEAEVVITDKDLAAFAGKAPAQRRTSPSNGGKKAAQAPVTSEKLATTDQLKTGSSVSALEKGTNPVQRTQKRDALAIYKDSLAEYRAGNYATALSGFQEFLASGPRDDYIDNALYWIGECQFGLGEFQTAVTYFNRVTNEQPDGNKVPDALLKMSMAYERLGQNDEAVNSLKKLTSQYPATNAGKMGAKKLETLN